MGHEMDTRVSRLLLFVSALAIAGACWGLQVAGLGCFGSIIIIIFLIPASRLEGLTHTHAFSYVYFTPSQLVSRLGRLVGGCWPMSMNGGQDVSD